MPNYRNICFFRSKEMIERLTTFQYPIPRFLPVHRFHEAPPSSFFLSPHLFIEFFQNHVLNLSAYANFFYYFTRVRINLRRKKQNAVTVNLILVFFCVRFFFFFCKFNIISSWFFFKKIAHFVSGIAMNSIRNFRIIMPSCESLTWPTL